MTKRKYLIKSRDGSVYEIEGVDAKDVICQYAAYCGIQSINMKAEIRARKNAGTKVRDSKK